MSQPLLLDLEQGQEALRVAVDWKVAAAADLSKCIADNLPDLSVCSQLLDQSIEADQDFDATLTVAQALIAGSAHVNHDPAIDVMDRVRSLSMMVPTEHAQRVESLFQTVGTLLPKTPRDTPDNRRRTQRGYQLAVAFRAFRQALDRIG